MLVETLKIYSASQPAFHPTFAVRKRRGERVKPTSTGFAQFSSSSAQSLKPFHRVGRRRDRQIIIRRGLITPGDRPT